MDVGRAAVHVGHLLRRPDVVDVPVGQQHRRRGEVVLVEDLPQRSHRPLARVDDDRVGAGSLGQHVAIARQHAGRESGDQHGVQCPISCSRGSRPPHSATPGTLVADRPDHEEDSGGADQRTTACNGEAQTRATAGAPGSEGTPSAASTRSSDPSWPLIVVIGAIVATVVITNRDSGQQDRVGGHDNADDRHQRRPVGAGTAARVRSAGQPGRQLPVPGRRDRRASRTTRRAPARSRPTRRRSAPAWRPTRAISGCSSTTPSHRARSTASPAWPSRVSSTTRRATG